MQPETWSPKSEDATWDLEPKKQRKRREKEHKSKMKSETWSPTSKDLEPKKQRKRKKKRTWKCNLRPGAQKAMKKQRKRKDVEIAVCHLEPKKQKRRKETEKKSEPNPYLSCANDKPVWALTEVVPMQPLPNLISLTLNSVEPMWPATKSQLCQRYIRKAWLRPCEP